MTYPYLKLSITNFVPELYLVASNNSEKKLINNPENLKDIIKGIAMELGFQDSIEILELLTIADSGDERLITELPEINTYANDFEIQEMMDFNIPRLLAQTNTHSNVKMSKEVEEELQKNIQIDRLASLIESVYAQIVARVLLVASEMGIQSFQLQDNSGLIRLQQKMSVELTKLGLTLNIV